MNEGQTRAKRRFGQNFLIDEAVIGHIMACVGPQPGDTLVEIGPGLGALTVPLLASGARLTALDIDPDMIAALGEKLGERSNFTLLEADALAFDFASTCPAGGQLRVIGNLPYNISTPLLLRLLGLAGSVRDMHVMVQREVALRLAAEPDCADYGRLSIAAQSRCEVELLFDVAPDSFRPAPSVVSSIVRLVPLANPPVPALLAALERVARQAFSQRRKMIRHTLGALFSNAELAALGIATTLRAENIPVATYLKLAELDAARR